MTDEMKPSNLWLRSLASISDISLAMMGWYLVINTWGTYNSAGDKQLIGQPAGVLMLGTVSFWLLPEWLGGATFEKWSCDLRVVSVSGKRISFVPSLKRNVLPLVDFFPWYLPGFICAKLTPNKQRLGDLWAKTMVVRRSEARPQNPVAISATNIASPIQNPTPRSPGAPSPASKQSPRSS